MRFYVTLVHAPDDVESLYTGSFTAVCALIAFHPDVRHVFIGRDRWEDCTYVVIERSY